MAIRILPNQPVFFHLADEVDCGCTGQSFCQIIAPTDATQFQLYSSDTVVNGDFAAGLTNWSIKDEISLLLEIENTDEEGECHGSVTITPTGGTGPYNYKLNGSGSGTSSNFFLGLCEGCYFVLVTDSLGQEATADFCIVVNVDCSEYEGATLDDVIASGKTLAEFYNCTLNDLKP